MPKKIDFAISSIVDLKAELFKKQQEFAKKKTENYSLFGPHGFANTKKPLFGKKSCEVSNAPSESAVKIKGNSEEEERKLRLSKERLLQKSALYDQLASSSVASDRLDSEYKALLLVDFDRKFEGNESGSDDERGDDVGKDDCDDIAAKNSDEEWTEYVDSFGRTRRCMRKDLSDFLSVDAKISSGRSTSAVKDCQPSSSVDHHLVEKEKSASETKSGPIHYQDVLKNEIRDHGAAYYQFSSDETERQQQMKRLEELRQQTLESRKISERLKEKRRLQMQARLAKVKERKGLTADIDFGDAIHDSSHANTDLSDILLPGEQEDQDNAARIKSDQDELKRAQHVRPWDKGKRKFYTQDEYLEKERKKRYTDFAPPSVYFTNS